MQRGDREQQVDLESELERVHSELVGLFLPGEEAPEGSMVHRFNKEQSRTLTLIWFNKEQSPTLNLIH